MSWGTDWENVGKITTTNIRGQKWQEGLETKDITLGSNYFVQPREGVTKIACVVVRMEGDNVFVQGLIGNGYRFSRKLDTWWILEVVNPEYRNVT